MGAVITALFIAFLQSILGWRNRPVLKVEFENWSPFCRMAKMKRPDGKEVVGYFVRLRVWNSGKSVARNVEGKLNSLGVMHGEEIGELVHEFDPVSLHWAGHSKDKGININRGGAFEYLDVLFVTDDEPNTIKLNAVEEEPRGIFLAFEKGEYSLRLAVYAENANPVEKEYRVK